jgi:hypothetical protein
MAQQIVDITKAPAIEPMLQSFEQLYTLRRPSEVLEFLDAHPFLGPLLLEAYGKIAQHFESFSDILLEVVTDPEAQGLVKMFGYIVTSLTPEEAGRRLRQFDREWFLSQIPRAKGLLNFDVEFQ